MKKRLLALILVLMLMLPSFSVFSEGQSTDFKSVADDESTELDIAEESVDLDVINEILNHIESYYKYDITREQLLEGAYKGITEVLDTHSSYFTDDEYKNFIDSLNSSLIGIGVYVEAFENYVKVISPIEGTPAFKAGLIAGDLITHVDDLDITTITFEEAINMIKGVEGTEVKITIKREGILEPINYNIIRELIIIDDVEYEMLEGNIGYIKVIQFGSNVYKEFSEAMLDLQLKGMTSIIIDLRNNPGGYLDEVIKIADYFVEKDDPIVHVDYRTLKDEDFYAKDDALNIPTVVLINGGSASASEILAGAIQNNDEGELVGTLSYGKGTVQNLLDFENGGAIKLTTAEYLTAGRVVINNVGVTPDYIVNQKTLDDIKLVESFAGFNTREESTFGKISLNIYAAQQRLNFIGYEIEVDGSFGPVTRQMLNSFQASRSLDVTDSLDEILKLELDKAVTEYLNADVQLLKAIELISK